MRVENIWFIQCPSFHGATLLSLLLAGHEDILSLGDTNPTRKFDGMCGCGEHVSQCDFWTTISKKTDADNLFGDLDTMFPVYPVLSRVWKLNQVLNSLILIYGNRIFAGNLFGSRAYSQFKNSYSAFLDEAWLKSPHKQFIDGQKSLLRILAVQACGFPVRGVIHLVRDPRGYVHSCIKYGQGDVSGAAREWLNHHARTKSILGKRFGQQKLLTVRYEDLASDTEQTLHKIADFMNIEADKFSTPDLASKKYHFVGNKGLKTFDGKISLNSAWKQSLSDQEQRLIEKITSPLFHEYGYTATG